MKSRVAILYGKVGGGHDSAARALEEALRQLGGPDAEVYLLDVYAASRFPLRLFPWLYHVLSVRLHPLCLKAVLAVLDTRPGFHAVETLSQSFNQPGLRRYLAQWQPTIVVSVVGGWAGSARSALDHLGNHAPVVTVVTDLMSVNRAWISPGAAAHVVPTVEVAAACVAFGVPQHGIRCLGLPLPEAPVSAPQPKASARRELGIDPTAPTVLLMGGAEGSGGIEAVLEALLSMQPDLQTIVITGRNEQLRHRLTRRLNGASRVLGYVSNVAEWMAAADVIVTKAGSMTVMEAMQRGLPMVLTGSLPQEIATEKYLRAHGAAEVAGLPREAAQAVISLLQDPRRCQALSRQATSLLRPGAAHRIAAFILECAAPHTTC
jgi:UDP-N-acetylglucosamine:LPS N-acetylglucosamine transferase